jgi:hypothetical protein
LNLTSRFRAGAASAGVVTILCTLLTSFPFTLSCHPYGRTGLDVILCCERYSSNFVRTSATCQCSHMSSYYETTPADITVRNGNTGSISIYGAGGVRCPNSMPLSNPITWPPSFGSIKGSTRCVAEYKGRKPKVIFDICDTGLYHQDS